MLDLGKIREFVWDAGNVDKSYKKYKITPNIAEEVFLDSNLYFIEDFKHSQKEKRFSALGKTKKEKILFVSFTVKVNKIRIISARPASRRERRQYEKT